MEHMGSVAIDCGYFVYIMWVAQAGAENELGLFDYEKLALDYVTVNDAEIRAGRVKTAALTAHPLTHSLPLTPTHVAHCHPLHIQRT